MTNLQAQIEEFRRSLPEILEGMDPPLDPLVYPGPPPCLIERWQEDGLALG